VDLNSEYKTCPKCKLVIDIYKISNLDVCPRCGSLLPARIGWITAGSTEDNTSVYSEKHIEKLTDKKIENQTKKQIEDQIEKQIHEKTKDETAGEDKPFELQTKTGSVWGSDEDREQLKDEIVLKGMKKLEYRGWKILNSILFIIIILFVTLGIIYRNQIFIWLFST
jgi:hypothetical protein